MRQLARDIRAGHDIHGIALVHRLGRLEIGEASVSIVVASAHRQAAYDASLAAINRLKKIVPVWKKEYFEDGEVWVEGDWEDSVPRPAGVLR
jgi:molybdopterin synthase catalytic subunit